jgi:putative MATE family efflux protein
MVGMASMRATGDTRLPSTLMMIGAILNVILDPIFIFGFGPVPALGLNGAAVAALIARGLIFIGAIYLLRGRLNMVSFNRPDPVELRQSWRDILHVGIPAAGTNAIVPIATAIITAMIAGYGPEAVAGFGVASRIESLVLVMFYALSAVIGPFVGQNLAVGNQARILESMRLSMMFCVGAGLLVAGLLALSANSLPSIFSDNESVIGVARLFLWIAPIGYAGYGLVMTINAAFNGLGKPMPGVVVSLMRTIILYVPLALVGQHFYGIAGIFAAYAAANVITGFVAYSWVKKTVHGLCAETA